MFINKNTMSRPHYNIIFIIQQALTLMIFSLFIKDVKFGVKALQGCI